jgi:hypothetical protein
VIAAPVATGTRVELAAALRADDVLLDDAVVALVGRDALVGCLVDAQPPASDRGRAPVLLVADRNRERRAVRRDRLDDQVIVAPRRALGRLAPDTAALTGPRHDPAESLLEPPLEAAQLADPRQPPKSRCESAT